LQHVKEPNDGETGFFYGEFAAVGASGSDRVELRVRSLRGSRVARGLCGARSLSNGLREDLLPVKRNVPPGFFDFRAITAKAATGHEL
jgi:hypothetical protein